MTFLELIGITTSADDREEAPICVAETTEFSRVAELEGEVPTLALTDIGMSPGADCWVTSKRRLTA